MFQVGVSDGFGDVCEVSDTGGEPAGADLLRVLEDGWGI